MSKHKPQQTNISNRSWCSPATNLTLYCSPLATLSASSVLQRFMQQISACSGLLLLHVSRNHVNTDGDAGGRLESAACWSSQEFWFKCQCHIEKQANADLVNLNRNEWHRDQTIKINITDSTVVYRPDRNMYFFLTSPPLCTLLTSCFFLSFTPDLHCDLRRRAATSTCCGCFQRVTVHTVNVRLQQPFYGRVKVGWTRLREDVMVWSGFLQKCGSPPSSSH